MSRILIVYESDHGTTRLVAERLTSLMEADGHHVEARLARLVPEDLSPADFDAVLVGDSIHVGKYHTRLLNRVRAWAPHLEARPSALFTVCLTASDDTEEARETLAGYLDDFVEATGWHPEQAEFIGGGLMYTKYNLIVRAIMKRIMSKEGRTTDSSKDHIFTDWDQVEQFGRTFLHRLQNGGASDRSDSEEATPGSEAPEEHREIT